MQVPVASLVQPGAFQTSPVVRFAAKAAAQPADDFARSLKILQGELPDGVAERLKTIETQKPIGAGATGQSTSWTTCRATRRGWRLKSPSARR